MSVLDDLLSRLPGASKPSGEVVPMDVGEKDKEQPPDVMPRDMETAALSLCKGMVAESDNSRRWQLQRVRKARDYDNGRQWMVWSAERQQYLPLSDVPSSIYGIDDGNSEDDDPVYTWNLYRATGEFIRSVITGGPPTVRFFPANADNPLDVATANAANNIVEIFHRTNSIDQLLAQESFYLYNDGMYAAYVRHVIDKQRFGERDEPIWEDVPKEISPAMYVCGNCGASNPQPPQCMSCGAPLSPESYVPPQTAMVPTITGSRKVPNGAEVVDLFGMLETRLPPEAKDLPDARYLVLQQEVDPSFLRALYPDKVKDINSKRSTLGLPEERIARMQQQAGAWMAGPFTGVDDKDNKVTYSRCWIRPSAFWGIDDEAKRQYFLDRYPDGAFFAFAGDTLLEDRNESMDDFWVICWAYPGEGALRPSIGDPMLDPQDALNDLMDVEMQVARHSVPTLFVDKQAVDPDEIRQSRVKGGQMYPVKRVTGDAIGASFFESSPSGPSPQGVVLRQEIFGGITQYLAGTLPGVTGQSDPNLKTAKAYAQAREQAMGRLAVIWRSMKEAHARMALLAVRHFIANRKGDVAFAERTPAGFRNKTIKYDDLQGQIIAYPESDEAYPVSASDKREQLNQLLQTGNPVLAGAVTSIENFDYFKSVNGLTGLKLPGESARNKQYREIEDLLKGQPQPQEIPGQPLMDPATGQPLIDPMTGQPAMSPPQMIEVSSVPTYQKTDDHQTEFLACQAWLNSEEGWTASKENPLGHRNVVLHAEAHFDAMQAMAPQGGPQ